MMHRLTSDDSSFAAVSVGVSGFTSVGVLGFTSVGVLGFTSVGAHVDSSCSCGGDKVLIDSHGHGCNPMSQRPPDARLTFDSGFAAVSTGTSFASLSWPRAVASLGSWKDAKSLMCGVKTTSDPTKSTRAPMQRHPDARLTFNLGFAAVSTGTSFVLSSWPWAAASLGSWKDAKSLMCGVKMTMSDDAENLPGPRTTKKHTPHPDHCLSRQGPHQRQRQLVPEREKNGYWTNYVRCSLGSLGWPVLYNTRHTSGIRSVEAVDGMATSSARRGIQSSPIPSGIEFS